MNCRFCVWASLVVAALAGPACAVSVVLRPASGFVSEVSYDQERARIILATANGLQEAEPWNDDPARRELTPIADTGPGRPARLAPGGRYAFQSSSPSGVVDELVDLVSGKTTARIDRPTGPGMEYVLLARHAQSLFTVTRGSANQDRWLQWSGSGSRVGEFSISRSSPVALSPDGMIVGWLEPTRFLTRNAEGRTLDSRAGSFSNAFISDRGARIMLTPDPASMKTDDAASLLFGTRDDRGQMRFETVAAEKQVLWTMGSKDGRVFYVHHSDHTEAVLQVRSQKWKQIDLDGEISELTGVPREDLQLTSLSIDDRGTITAILTEHPMPWSHESAEVRAFVFHRPLKGGSRWTELPRGRASAKLPKLIWVSGRRSIVQGVEYAAAVDFKRRKPLPPYPTEPSFLSAATESAQQRSINACSSLRAPLHNSASAKPNSMSTLELIGPSEAPEIHKGFDLKGVAHGDPSQFSAVIAVADGDIAFVSACGQSENLYEEIQVESSLWGWKLTERYAHVNYLSLNLCSENTNEVYEGQCLGQLQEWSNCSGSTHLHYEVVLDHSSGILQLAPDSRIDGFHDEIAPKIGSVSLCDDDQIDSFEPWQNCTSSLTTSCIQVSEDDKLDVVMRVEDVSLLENAFFAYTALGISLSEVNVEIAPKELGYTLCDDGSGQCDEWASLYFSVVPSCLVGGVGSCDAYKKIRAVHSFKEPFKSRAYDACKHDEHWYVVTNNDPDVWFSAPDYPGWAAEHYLDLSQRSGPHTLKVRAVDYSGNVDSSSMPLCIGSTPQWKLVIRDCFGDNGVVPSECYQEVSPDIKLTAEPKVEVCFRNLGSGRTPAGLIVDVHVDAGGRRSMTTSKRLNRPLAVDEEHCVAMDLDPLILNRPDLRKVIRAELTHSGNARTRNEDELMSPQLASVSVLRALVGVPVPPERGSGFWDNH